MKDRLELELIYDRVRELSKVGEIDALLDQVFPDLDPEEEKTSPDVARYTAQAFMRISFEKHHPHKEEHTTKSRESSIVNGKPTPDSKYIESLLKKGVVSSWNTRGMPIDKYFFLKALAFKAIIELMMVSKKNKREENKGRVGQMVPKYMLDEMTIRAAKANDDCRIAEDKINISIREEIPQKEVFALLQDNLSDTKCLFTLTMLVTRNWQIYPRVETELPVIELGS